MTELGVSCRLGIPSARLTAKRIISPSNHSPRLSLDCRALYSRHIISLSALFALAPIFPSSCAVQAVLYPHLALGFFSAGPQEHFPCEPWPPKDQSLSYELKVNPQIVFFFTVLPNNTQRMQLQTNTNINPLLYTIHYEFKSKRYYNSIWQNSVKLNLTTINHREP